MSKRVLVVKPGPEFILKTEHVQKFFLNKLTENINASLKKNSLKFETVYDRTRLLIYSENLEDVQKILERVFGIQSSFVAQEFVFSSFDDLVEKVLQIAVENLQGVKTFAVRANRTKNHKFTSKQIEEELGGKILEKIPSLKVNLKHPEKTVFVDLREKRFFV
ncbi:MAG: THUMP domain-containing protein, partial [Candidatus Diapherotrites archaeon]|nr:THUMP domain-containing protein [Candidatus Diapherotrites archaeon]